MFLCIKFKFKYINNNNNYLTIKLIVKNIVRNGREICINNMSDNIIIIREGKREYTFFFNVYVNVWCVCVCVCVCACVDREIERVYIK